MASEARWIRTSENVLYLIAQHMFAAGRDYGRGVDETYDQTKLEQVAVDTAWQKVTGYHKSMGAIVENSVG
jgi:hypothetical protein